MVDGPTFATFEPQANVSKTKVTQVDLMAAFIRLFKPDVCLSVIFSVIFLFGDVKR